MSGRRGYLLIALLGVLVLAAGYTLLWKPRADDLATVRSENEDLTFDLDAARTAMTATPPRGWNRPAFGSTRTTFSTPGTFKAPLSSSAFTVPPNTTAMTAAIHPACRVAPNTA